MREKTREAGKQFDCYVLVSAIDMPRDGSRRCPDVSGSCTTWQTHFVQSLILLCVETTITTLGGTNNSDGSREHREQKSLVATEAL